MEKLFDIGGKVALVTGASKGIGEMIATGLVKSGVKTYINSRKQEELSETAERLSKFGQCVPLTFDLSSLAGVEKLVNKVQELESALPILINNAGAT